MPGIQKNSFLTGLHGSVGGLVIVHQKGRVWTRSKPKGEIKPTARRKTQWKNMRQASKWASELPKQAPEIAAKYQKAANGTIWSWQNLAIADAMHGPVIEEIDLSAYTGRSGERIRVQAIDAVKPPMKLGVAEVRVVIRDMAGVVVEQGKAAVEGTTWVYITQTEVPPGQILKVEVMATDQPSNHATRTVPHLTRP